MRFIFFSDESQSLTGNDGRTAFAHSKRINIRVLREVEEDSQSVIGTKTGKRRTKRHVPIQSTLQSKVDFFSLYHMIIGCRLVDGFQRYYYRGYCVSGAINIFTLMKMLC